LPTNPVEVMRANPIAPRGHIEGQTPSPPITPREY